MNRKQISIVVLTVLSVVRPAQALVLGSQTVASQENTSSLHGDLSLFLHATWPSMFFVVDRDDDHDLSSGTHSFTWSRDNGARMMELRSSNLTTDDGDLRIGGQLAQNYGFDLAETFRVDGPIEAGELVAIDPRRSDGVRRTRGAYDRLVIGVVSTRPGILMGGVPFSVEDLRQIWGEEAGQAFENERAALEAEVVAERPDLGSARDRRLPPGIASDEASAELAAVDLALQDEVMRRFFSAHFAPVAVSGRVPIKVDASFGPIRPGDYLTSSPIPGVAMKATRSGPIIGSALEGLALGSGRIQVLVDRGWFGGEPADVAGVEPTLERQLATKDARIAALERRLRELEGTVRRLTSRSSKPERLPASAK